MFILVLEPLVYYPWSSTHTHTAVRAVHTEHVCLDLIWTWFHERVLSVSWARRWERHQCSDSVWTWTLNTDDDDDGEGSACCSREKGNEWMWFWNCILCFTRHLKCMPVTSSSAAASWHSDDEDDDEDGWSVDQCLSECDDDDGFALPGDLIGHMTACVTDGGWFLVIFVGNVWIFFCFRVWG